MLFFSIIIIFIFCASSLIVNKLEDSILSTKKTELTTAASEYSTSLSDYGLTSPLSVSLDYSKTNRRVIVADANLNIVFDSYDPESIVNKTMFHPAIVRAINGEEYFSFARDSSEVSACASAPFFLDGDIVGVVSVFETDTAFPEIFNSIELATFALCIIVIFLLLLTSILILILLKKRIHFFSKEIKSSQNDGIMNKISPEHTDEFKPILDEFNKISERFNYVQGMRQAFVSDASHELRTPLTAIRLLCESITQTDNMDADTVREFMEDIILEVDRMSHTAEKLLVLSKLDNASKSTSAPLPLSEIVNKMITAFEPIAEKKEVKILPYIDENCYILGDMEGANQIVGNLIDNAIKYNNFGGTLKIYLYSNGKECTFITDDTGIGIAPEEREHVFERFYRVDKSRKHDGRGGSGLGLAIVKRNVESFGGTIAISDSIDGGTRFTVVFPSLASDEEV